MTRPHHPPPFANDERGDCPSLVDLAALCEGRLTGDALERIEIHVARCEACLEPVRGLRAEAPEIEDESRMILVPAHVLAAAMGLRERDAKERLARVLTPARGAVRPWMTGARRGLAAAAMLGIVAGGYSIGRSLTVEESGIAATDTDTSGLTFGLLDVIASGDDAGTSEDDGFSLFTISLKEGQS